MSDKKKLKFLGIMFWFIKQKGVAKNLRNVRKKNIHYLKKEIWCIHISYLIISHNRHIKKNSNKTYILLMIWIFSIHQMIYFFNNDLIILKKLFNKFITRGRHIINKLDFTIY